MPHFGHTPYNHEGHKVRCGCAPNRETAKFICKHCLALYTNEPMSFNQWRCYDCGKFNSLKWYEQNVDYDPDLNTTRSDIGTADE